MSLLLSALECEGAIESIIQGIFIKPHIVGKKVEEGIVSATLDLLPFQLISGVGIKCVNAL